MQLTNLQRSYRSILGIGRFAYLQAPEHRESIERLETYIPVLLNSRFELFVMKHGLSGPVATYDIGRICDAEGIQIGTCDFSQTNDMFGVKGAYLPGHDNGQPAIWIDSRLSPTHQKIVALHELGHHILGHSGRSDDFDTREELEADFFAAMCLSLGN